MTKKKTTKRRTQIKDLPRKEKELTKDEQKKVKGGGNLFETLQGILDSYHASAKQVAQKLGK